MIFPCFQCVLLIEVQVKARLSFKSSDSLMNMIYFEVDQREISMFSVGMLQRY